MASPDGLPACARNAAPSGAISARIWLARATPSSSRAGIGVTRLALGPCPPWSFLQGASFGPGAREPHAVHSSISLEPSVPPATMAISRTATMAAGLYREAREIRANAGGRIARGDEIADDGHGAGARANDLRRGLERHTANRYQRHSLLARAGRGAANALEAQAGVAGHLGVRPEHRPDCNITHRGMKGRLQLFCRMRRPPDDDL